MLTAHLFHNMFKECYTLLHTKNVEEQELYITADHFLKAGPSGQVFQLSKFSYWSIHLKSKNVSLGLKRNKKKKVFKKSIMKKMEYIILAINSDNSSQ